MFNFNHQHTTKLEPEARLLPQFWNILERYFLILNTTGWWEMENIGPLNFNAISAIYIAVIVDLVSLKENELVSRFEVVIRQYKTIGFLRKAMMQA